MTFFQKEGDNPCALPREEFKAYTYNLQDNSAPREKS